MTTKIKKDNRPTGDPALAPASGSASPLRKDHLIKGIRYWLNRAEEKLNRGYVSHAKIAVGKASEALDNPDVTELRETPSGGSEQRLVSEQAVISACNSIQKSNDNLGRYSDHEGNRDGSTWYFWKQGKEKFASQVERAIKDHERAIRAWRRIGKLNNAR